MWENEPYGELGEGKISRQQKERVHGTRKEFLYKNQKFNVTEMEWLRDSRIYDEVIEEILE